MGYFDEAIVQQALPARNRKKPVARKSDAEPSSAKTEEATERLLVSQDERERLYAAIERAGAPRPKVSYKFQCSFTEATFERLRLASVVADKPIARIIREAVEQFLDAKGY